MGKSCSGYGCTNRYGKLRENGEKLQFHLFPHKNPDLLKQWVIATRRDNWNPSKSAVLCGEHFTRDSYISSASKFLKKDAIPSIFNFPEHLKKYGKKRKAIVKHSPVLKKQRTSEGPSSSGWKELLKLPTATELQTDVVAGEALGIKEEKSSPTRQELIKTIKSLRGKVKCLQEKLRRRDKKISNLKNLIEAVKPLDMSKETSDMLQYTYGAVPFNLIVNHLKNIKSKPKGRRYSQAMKEFALTLYFYSPRSYNFLRKKIILPHPAQLRKWVSSVSCYPGFMEEPFNYLQKLVQTVGNMEFALIIDSMSIRKQVIWDKVRNKFSGYIECCGMVDGKEQCLASEALVFLIVSVTKNIKCPIAYFLIDKIGSTVLCQLVRVALQKLHAIGVNVCSVTADGISSNVQAFELLGCSFKNCSVNDMKTSFPHPTTGFPIYAMFDPCHMLKLARNVLAEKSTLTSNSGNINWHYLKELNKVQDLIGFKFANKLSGSHINYQNKKMNVSLAAQTLSSGTADALDFLTKVKDYGFSGAEATIEYIRYIDRLFDLLNSRNPFSSGFKSPLKLANQQWWEGIFQQTVTYLSNLKLNGIPILKSQRKMFALGFIVTIKSVMSLALKLLQKPVNPLKYFLVYKVSQDHIELFFNSIRACGGYNNNPNAHQFRYALRKLLLAGNISARNSNCIDNNVVLPSILEYRSPKRSLRDLDTEDEDDEVILEMYSECLKNQSLADYQQNILYYIGGYIVKSILKKLSCQSCISALVCDDNNDHPCFVSSRNPKSFTSFVSRGGLMYCSFTVFKIICLTEKVFKAAVDKKNLNSNLINIKLKIVALEHLHNEGIKLSHPIENELGCEDLHEMQLTTTIISKYLQLRLHSYSAKLTLQNVYQNQASIRSKLTKLIIFKNV